MPYTYTGDDTAGIITAAELPSDGDLRDAISVDAALEALLDSMATLATGNPTFAGDPEFTGDPNFRGDVQFLDGTCGFFGEDVVVGGSLVSGISTWLFDASTEVTFAELSITTIEGTVWVQTTTGDVRFRNDGTLRIESTGFLKLFGDGSAIWADGMLSVKEDGEIRALDGSIVRVQDGAELRVESGGLAHFNVGGLLDFGGTSSDWPNDVCIDIGDDLVIANRGTIVNSNTFYVSGVAGSISWRDVDATDSNINVETGSWDYIFIPNLTGNRIYTLGEPAPLAHIPNHTVWFIRNGAEATNSLTFKDFDGTTIFTVGPESGTTRTHYSISFYWRGTPGWVLRHYAQVGPA